MAKKLFYVKDFYIVAKHKENWKAVKGMLDLPIWKRATEKPKDRYKEELERKIKDIQRKGLPPEKKMEEIKDLKKKLKLKHEIGKVRTTYRTLLKVMGDLICERGNPPALTERSILSKFEEIANKEYDDLLISLENRVKKKIKDNDPRQEKEIERYKEQVEAKRKEHFDRLKHTEKKKKSNKKKKKTSRKQKERVDVKDRIDRLNTWLNKYGNATFVKRVGTDFKLLVYRAEGEGEQELFCSDKNKDKFLEIINEMGEKKRQFEGIEYIKPFENVLKASPIEKIEYFRDLGPLSVHFKNGWMVRRQETDGLKEKIGKIDDKHRNNVYLLMGDTASGKTVITRNIGYDLWKESWKVYEISIRDLVDEDKRKSIRWGLDYLENISNKVLVIIENVHQESDKISSFLEWILNRYSKTRFLLTTWDLYDIYTRKERNVFDRCEKEDLAEANFSELADSIILNYFGIENESDKKEFLEYTEIQREDIKNISKGNLWVLSYLLRGWKLGKGIELETVYELIKEDIVDLGKEFVNNYGIDGVKEALLALAPLSQFELGVSTSFLNQKSGVIKTNASLLKKLKKHGKIIQKNGFYSIPHSTLARLYMETAIHYTDENGVSSLLIDLIDEFKESIFSGDVKNYPLETIQAYLKSNPRNYGEVVNKVCGYEAGFFQRKGDLRYIVDRFKEKRNIPLKTLLLDDETFKALIKSLRQSDVRNLGLFLCGINAAAHVPSVPASKDLTIWLRDIVDEDAFLEEQDIEKFVENIDINTLISKIEEEPNVTAISYCFAGIMHCFDKDFHKIFLDRLSHLKIRVTIKNSDASFLDAVYTINPLLIMNENLFDEYKDVLIYKAKTEANLFTLGEGLQALTFGYSEIVDNLYPNDILSKFEKESDLSNISMCIKYVIDIILNSESQARRLIKIMPSKINAEKELVNITVTLGVIGGHGKRGVKTVDKIIDKIDGNLLRSKINEKNQRFIEGVWLYYPKGKEGAKLILDRLNLWELMDEKSRKRTLDFIYSRGQFKDV